MTARFQHASEFTHRLLRILDVLETFQTSNIFKRLITEWQFSIQIPTVHVHAIESEDFRVQIATTNVKSGINETGRERAFSCGHIQQHAAGLIRQQPDNCVMNGFVRQRNG
jgi:hypothetical protein